MDTKKCLTPAKISLASAEPLHPSRVSGSLSSSNGVGFAFSVEDGLVLVVVGPELFYCIQCGVGNWAVASGG